MYRKSRLKVVGFALLACVAAAAASASTAQAAWTLKENSVSTLHLVVSGFFNLGVIRTTSQKIHCKSNFFGEALVALSPDHKTSSTSVSWIASCDVTGLEEVCDVSSPGESQDVLFEASGSMAMNGGTASGKLEGEDIATLEYTGSECPFTELQASVSGSMAFSVAKAAEEATTHEVALNEVELFLGEEEALLEGEEEEPSITGSFKGKGGAKFSIAFTP